MPNFEEICAQYDVRPQDVVYCFTLSDGSHRLIMKDGFNPVYSVLWDDDSDIQISFGGRGSGKSNDMSRRIVADNYNGHNWLVTRYFKVDLKTSMASAVFCTALRTVLSRGIIRIAAAPSAMPAPRDAAKVFSSTISPP